MGSWEIATALMRPIRWPSWARSSQTSPVGRPSPSVGRVNTCTFVVRVLNGDLKEEWQLSAIERRMSTRQDTQNERCVPVTTH